MTKFYIIDFAWKRSCIEVLPNIESKDYEKYLLPYKNQRLPEQTTFCIKAFKKEYDIIGIYQYMSLQLYSKELISILSSFTDMSDKCYKISLPDATKEYFVIYNLPTHICINLKAVKNWVKNFWPDRPIYRFVINDSIGPVFTLDGFNCVIVSEEIRKALTKAKITNIDFREVYGYTPEEALEWARENPDCADDFADTDWFKELLQK